MNKRTVYTIISIAIWLAVWFVAASIINNDIFLPGPVSVIKALGSLIVTREFYLTVLNSLWGITKGFLIGITAGIILAIPSSLNGFIKSVIDIPIKVIKAIPVASFVILALIWLSSANLSTLIAAMMVLPIIYTNVLSGISNTDNEMLQFANVYRLGKIKKIRYIYTPSVIEPLIAACTVAAGFAWKSGVAAEIIGLIRNSIGNELYKSKLYLEIPNLFAWTITIIIVSVIFEKITVLIIKGIGRLLGGIR